jgi:arylformamidase
LAAKFYDLSHFIENGMSFFPGDPQPQITPAEQAMPPWQVSALSIGSHTGTHIDAASHFIPSGNSIDQYPLKRLILPGIVIPIPNLVPDQVIEADMLAPHLPHIRKGGALLIKTGWDRYWQTGTYEMHPFLSRDAALLIDKAGIGLLGIDALNVDSTVQATSHVHEVLLGGDVLIVENLKGLMQLEPDRLYQFSFLPLLLKGLDGSPIRAVAWED